MFSGRVANPSLGSGSLFPVLHVVVQRLYIVSPIVPEFLQRGTDSWAGRGCVGHWANSYYCNLLMCLMFYVHLGWNMDEYGNTKIDKNKVGKVGNLETHEVKPWRH